MKFQFIVFTFVAMALIVPADAKSKGGGKANAQAQAAQKKREAEKKERDKKRDAVESFMKQKDLNHDGSLTREEYLTGESDAVAAGKVFDQYNLNKDRYLTKNEIEALLHL